MQRGEGRQPVKALILPLSSSSRAQERLAELRREFEKEGFPRASGVHVDDA